MYITLRHFRANICEEACVCLHKQTLPRAIALHALQKVSAGVVDPPRNMVLGLVSLMHITCACMHGTHPTTCSMVALCMTKTAGREPARCAYALMAGTSRDNTEGLTRRETTSCSARVCVMITRMHVCGWKMWRLSCKRGVHGR